MNLAELSTGDQSNLLVTARAAIQNALDHNTLPKEHYETSSPALRLIRSSFVTLLKQGQLRGCIGNLTANRELIKDVAENAYAAAFKDPRFPPVQAGEFALLNIEISVLNPASPMRFSSESDLLEQLRPGIDGLILEEGRNRATFLPTVWESLPEPEQFLTHLKYKAGLATTYWSDQLEISRYTTFSFQE